MLLHIPSGRDPTDHRTIDLEAWISAARVQRADRLRAAHPELEMVQLPLDLHERAVHRIRALGDC